MGLAHHQPQAGEAAFFERGHELAPEALALTVAHLELQQLPAAIRVHPHGDDHGSGADLQGLAQPAMEVGGIEVNVGVAGLLQEPVHEGLHLFVDVLTEATQLRLGDGALHPKSSQQGIHFAGGDPTDVGLHDNGVEGLVHPAAGFQDRGQEAPTATFGDQQVDVAHLGGQAAGSVTVAVAEPLLTALVGLCADHGSDLELDQLLQTAPHQLGDQLSGGASVQ